MYTNDPATPHLHIIFARHGKFADGLGHSMEYILYIKYSILTVRSRTSYILHIFLHLLRHRATKHQL